MSEYILTERGTKKVEKFLQDFKAKRKEILDAKKDTCRLIPIPKEEDILIDLNMEYLGDQFYRGTWNVTDNYEVSITLEELEDFILDCIEKADDLYAYEVNFLLSEFYGIVKATNITEARKKVEEVYKEKFMIDENKLTTTIYRIYNFNTHEDVLVFSDFEE